MRVAFWTKYGPLSAALLLTLIIVGCGRSGTVGKVVGRVTVDGTPLTAGKIQFSPIGNDDNPNPGKPAVGRIQEDGSFVLGTFKDNDGAIVGIHRVAITQKRQKDDPPSNRIPPFDYLKLFGQEFEVQRGKNEINIELTADQVRELGTIDDD